MNGQFRTDQAQPLLKETEARYKDLRRDFDDQLNAVFHNGVINGTTLNGILNNAQSAVATQHIANLRGAANPCNLCAKQVIALRRQIYQNTRNPDDGHLAAIRFWEQVVADWEKWYEDLEEIEARRGL